MTYEKTPTPNKYCKQYRAVQTPIYLNTSDFPEESVVLKEPESAFCSNCGQSFATHNNRCDDAGLHEDLKAKLEDAHHSFGCPIHQGLTCVCPIDYTPTKPGRMQAYCTSFACGYMGSVDGPCSRCGKMVGKVVE